MPDVPYTTSNVVDCLCYDCPVQAGSACAHDRYAKVARSLEATEPPPATDLPGMYCATGTSTCDDLDFTEMCQCMGCAVYARSRLDQLKYCQRGSAAQIG